MQSARELPPWCGGRCSRTALGSALMGMVCAAVLLATSPRLPMVWDEGNAILRAEKIPHEWPYTTELEGHPAFYGIVIAVGQQLAPACLRPLDAARLGPMLLLAAAAAAMCYRMWRDYSATAAIGSVAAMMLLPRVFAHVHFASFDGPLTSCWMLAWAAFAPACGRSNGRGGQSPFSPLESVGEIDVLPAKKGTVPGKTISARTLGLDSATWAAVVLWGVTLGMTLSCKATGWLAPMPFLLWAVVYRNRAALRAVGVGLPVALVTFFVLNPPLWHDPICGWLRFFDLNLHRGAQGLNIATQFFGRMYDLDHSLPWYNTLVWVGITVPVGILLLVVVGVTAALWRWRSEPAGILLLCNGLVLLVARAMPGTPPHDAERLLLPSFAFLAALAGVGCHQLLGWSQRRWEGKSWRHGLAFAGVVSLYLGSASSLVWYAPQWLSYYNLLIGGLPGATAAGMEPTYYWDGLDRSVLDWLDAHTADNEKIAFAAISDENLELLRRWGMLRRQTSEAAPGRFRWYVLQRRPSGLQPVDQWLIEHARAAYCKTIRAGGVGPWRLDVPLVEIYPYEDYQRAVAAQKAATAGRAARPAVAAL